MTTPDTAPEDRAREIADTFANNSTEADLLFRHILAYGRGERERAAKVADEQAIHATLCRVHGTVGASLGQRVAEAIATAIREMPEG